MSDGEAVIREIWRRWNAGTREYDPELLHPDIEIHSALTMQRYDGEAGVNRWTAEIDDQFDEWELSIDEIEELTPSRFVVRGSVRARGRQSGVDLDQPVVWSLGLRDGRLMRLKNFIGPEAEASARAEAQ